MLNYMWLPTYGHLDQYKPQLYSFMLINGLIYAYNLLDSSLIATVVNKRKGLFLML